MWGRKGKSTGNFDFISLGMKVQSTNRNMQLTPPGKFNFALVATPVTTTNNKTTNKQKETINGKIMDYVECMQIVMCTST